MFERAFTFPKESKTAHVKIMTKATQTLITMTTVCLRFFTKLTRDYSLFSLAVPKQGNSFLLWSEKNGVYSVYVNGQGGISGLKGKLNEWNSLCATWENTTGLTQVWLNGKPSKSMTVSPGYSIKGIPIIVLGQDQDTYGGSFDAAQSLVGSLTDVHMWAFVLSPKEIQYYMKGIMVYNGDVVSWRQMEFTVTDAVVEETSVLGFVYRCN